MSKLLQLKRDIHEHFLTPHMRDFKEEYFVLLHVIVGVMRDDINNINTNTIEDLDFVISRGYFDILVNAHIVKPPQPFYEEMRKRRKFLMHFYGEDYIETENEILLKRIKRTYYKIFKQRRRSVSILVNTISHFSCADIGRWSAYFIGCYDCLITPVAF